MFRFTTRDVLWLMVVVAMAMGAGWCVHVRAIRLTQAKRDTEAYNRSLEVLDRAKSSVERTRKRMTELQTVSPDKNSPRLTDPLNRP